MGKSEQAGGVLESQNDLESKVHMENLLISKDLWECMSKDAAVIRSVEQKRDARKAMSLVRGHVSPGYLPYLQ
jgi:hypothetical protein